MNIKDPGLRTTFEGMLNDGRIDTSEVNRLITSAKDYNTITTTETKDLENILLSLRDQLTPEARQTLETFLGINPTPTPSFPAPAQGMSALNLTLQAMSGRPLEEMDLNRSQDIFAASAKGGVTSLEENKLQEVYNTYASRWSSQVREFWRVGISNLRRPEGGILRGATGAAEPEDLSSRLKTLWIQGYSDNVQRAFVEDLVLLAHDKGLKVTLHLDQNLSVGSVARDLTARTGLSLQELDKVLDIVRSDTIPSVWGEDNKILTDGDDVRVAPKVLVPPDIGSNSFSRAMLYTANEGYHPSQPGSFQGAVDERGEAYISYQLAKELGRDSKITECYIEGGNMVPGTTTDGKPYALVGRDSLILSAYHLDDSRKFSRSAVDAQVRKMETTGAFKTSEVDETARRLKAMDVALQNGWFDAYLDQPTTLPNQIRPTQADITKAKEFLAKLELTKDLMAKDVGIPKERLVFIDQPEFHIDMAVRPLGPGEVMVNHPRRSIQLLDEALRDPQLRSSERRELQEMRTHAQRELTELGPVYDRIIQQLESSGLLVAQAPGVFESNSRKANFMNAVPGHTPDGTATYITIGSSIKPLERAFETFVKSLGVEDVHFVGGKMVEYGMTAGEVSLEMMGGIDCREVGHAGTDDSSKDLLKRYIENL